MAELRSALSYGVLFDMDGVLVQTEPLKAQAHAAATRQCGGDVLPELYATVMGQSLEVIMKAFLTAGQVDAELSDYASTFERVYRKLLQTQLAPNSPVVELLPPLKQYGYRLGLVTSDYANVRDWILAQLGLTPYFDVLVAKDDVTQIKPAPDGYLLALKRMPLTPARVIVIEDSEAGLQAASSAGLRVLAIRHAFNTNHNFGSASKILDPFHHSPVTILQTIKTMLET
jgi:HAD superfamily hydrolase (TIGR01509 family)